jgi:hypothetical protein
VDLKDLEIHEEELEGFNFTDDGISKIFYFYFFS